jgi:hypothetical protein
LEAAGKEEGIQLERGGGYDKGLNDFLVLPIMQSMS